MKLSLHITIHHIIESGTTKTKVLEGLTSILKILYEIDNMNMKVVYYFKVYAELLYAISRYRT